MPSVDDFPKSVLQLVDDALNSAMEAETKISEEAERFERAIDVTSGLKGSSSDDPVANRNSAGAATEVMARASMNDMPGALVAGALRGNMYPKVGVYYCCTPYG